MIDREKTLERILNKFKQDPQWAINKYGTCKSVKIMKIVEV